MKSRLPVDYGTTVYAHNSNNNIEKLLRKFKKRVQNSNVLVEYKERRYFVKPSEIKREKIKKARFSATTKTAKIK